MKVVASTVQSKLDELDELYRLQHWLEPMALLSLALQAWALFEVQNTDEHYGTAFLAAFVGLFLIIWAISTRLRSNALEGDVGTGGAAPVLQDLESDLRLSHSVWSSVFCAVQTDDALSSVLKLACGSSGTHTALVGRPVALNDAEDRTGEFGCELSQSSYSCVE